MNTLPLLVMLFISLWTLPRPIQAKEIEAKLENKFTLNVGDVARIKSINAELYFKGFTIFPDCGKNNGRFFRECDPYWIEYEFHVDGKVYTNRQSWYEAPFDIMPEAGDLKTYAEFTIKDPVAHCESLKDNPAVTAWNRGDCWQRLALRLSDFKFCEKLSNIQDHHSEVLNDQDHCREVLIDQLGKPELCDKVKTPQMFCKYREAINQLNLNMCSSVITWKHKLSCYKEISSRTGQGVEMCKHIINITPREMEICEDSISGKIRP